MNSTLAGSLKSKLMWLGLAISMFGYLQANLAMLSAFIPAKYFGLVNMGLGALVMLARFFTTESLSDKGNSGAGATP